MNSGTPGQHYWWAAFGPTAGTPIYYSVGTNAAALYTGNCVVPPPGRSPWPVRRRTTSAWATRSAERATNRYYITGRVSSTVFTIQNSAANGGTPGATNITFASGTNITIYRAFTSLARPKPAPSTRAT